MTLNRCSHAERHGRAGFTLIELLVSIVVLSIGIVVVLEAFQTSLTALGSSRDSLMADVFARQRMGLVDFALVTQPSAAPSSGSGVVSGYRGGFVWQQAVSDESSAATPATEGDAAYTVSVTVGPTAADGLQTLTTIVRTREASP